MERAPYEHKCCHQIIHALFEDFSFIGVIFHNYFVPLQLLNDISDMAIGITEELAKLRLKAALFLNYVLTATLSESCRDVSNRPSLPK